jgi:hypothetical protein
MYVVNPGPLSQQRVVLRCWCKLFRRSRNLLRAVAIYKLVRAAAIPLQAVAMLLTATVASGSR